MNYTKQFIYNIIKLFSQPKINKLDLVKNKGSKAPLIIKDIEPKLFNKYKYPMGQK
tara:strand:- start:353 stop:520 length:168 start_codon:yes stop_codon:yes gene_type:complete